MCFPSLCMSGAWRVGLLPSQVVWAGGRDRLPECAKPFWGNNQTGFLWRQISLGLANPLSGLAPPGKVSSP